MAIKNADIDGKIVDLCFDYWQTFFSFRKRRMKYHLSLQKGTRLSVSFKMPWLNIRRTLQQGAYF